MAVHFITGTPSTLLASFKKAISDKQIVTWSCDSAGDFTHATDQWKNLAWFRPEVKSDRLIFKIIRPQGLKVGSEVYAIYHGRLIESILAHFDNSFTNAFATALASDGDLI